MVHLICGSKDVSGLPQHLLAFGKSLIVDNMIVDAHAEEKFRGGP